ncbi:uncharacterized protein KY384_007788 [Bacidia gigantensis]|uniref:uncharacterized protein n=1 Tax=Bacidia gigantensis TaxID=2732470 RepID=UPI001D05740A|nr:uncharacterized protein KY384_007788 [Bacidia gigantensis]KAG8527635.1 hypothetical protein KY384_007788 [Bacidia gigantensis]
MSFLNENVLGPSRRRTSRASSRASSRAGSEEIDGEFGATPRRSGRLAAQGTKVGNKESAAYGAKAKPLSNPELSANAQQDATASITAAVAGATATLPPTGGEAGQLPVINEEPESSSAAANRPRERNIDDENPGGQGGPILETTNQGRRHHETICSKLRGLIGWAPGQQRNPENDPVNASEVPTGSTGIVNTSVSKPLLWILGIAMLLLIAMAVLQVDLYTGPRLKPNINLLAKHFANVPVGTTIVHDPRLSTMEKLIYGLTSKSKTPEIAPSQHQIDWFAHANRAAIDPYLTSPTFDPENCSLGLRNWSHYIKSFFVGTRGYWESIAPASALRPWSEPDDRWCAPPSYGQLQLAIITSRMISPTELIIEHLPRGAAIYIGTAPRQIELWMEISDRESYTKLYDVTKATYPELLARSSPQSLRDLDDDQALPGGYIRIGRWTYDIRNPQYKQTFTVPFALKELEVKSNHFALRVLDNWGDNVETCIYRTRLHGHDMQGPVEVLHD